MENSPPLNSQLQLSSDDMRRLGYQVVDMLVEHYEALASKPVQAYTESGRPAMEARFREPLPQYGTDIDTLLQQIRQDVLEQNYHRTHPRDFAYVSGPSNFVGVLADTLAAGYNVFAGAWVASPAAAMIELVTIDWLRQLIGMPESTGGILTSGGSMANLTGLAVARHIKLADDLTGAVAYLSEQTHISLSKSLRVLGFQAHQIRKIPVDSDYRMSAPALSEAVEQDRQHGLRPFCVIATAGATNTGTVDPLEDITALCRANDLWLHIDGAYGAAAALSEKGRAGLRGIEHADSLAIDPHKWLFQPFELGCTLVRDQSHLRATFSVTAEYLKNLVDPMQQEVNFYDYGVEMSRGFRALKLWMSLKAFGVESFRAAVTHGIDLAETAERTLRQLPAWEIVTPGRLGIITFRYHVDGLRESQLNTLNDHIAKSITASGYAFVHTTILNGRTVLRLVTINPRTTDEMIEETIRRLTHIAEQLSVTVL